METKLRYPLSKNSYGHHPGDEYLEKSNWYVKKYFNAPSIEDILSNLRFTTTQNLNDNLFHINLEIERIGELGYYVRSSPKDDDFIVIQPNCFSKQKILFFIGIDKLEKKCNHKVCHKCYKYHDCHECYRYREGRERRECRECRGFNGCWNYSPRSSSNLLQYLDLDKNLITICTHFELRIEDVEGSL